MNYEKKYKEAFERAKKELNTCGSQDCDAARQIFRLFPELKESEDEKMRRELIAYFRNNSVSIKWSGLDVKKVIEWLEKQKYTQRDVDDAYLKGICDAKHELEKQGEHDNWAEELNNRIKELHRQCLAKIQEYVTPCWEKMSEEDERIRKELIFYLGDMPEDTELRNGVTNRDVLTLLEKQKTKV